MPPFVVPFKAGLVLLAGIVSAPVLKPLLEKTVKATVKAGIRLRDAAADATSGLEVLALEATREKHTAEKVVGSVDPAPAPQNPR